MQPRTKKEKTWANDVTSETPQKSTHTEEPVVFEDHDVAESTPEEESEVLDDLEWLKRRTVTGNIEKSIGSLDIGKDAGPSSSKQVHIQTFPQLLLNSQYVFPRQLARRQLLTELPVRLRLRQSLEPEGFSYVIFHFHVRTKI